MSDDTFTDQPRTIRQVYQAAMLWTTVGWVAVLASMLLIAFCLPGLADWPIADATLVAVGSLLVAYISLTPGLQRKGVASGICSTMLSGITIRLLGTVALFLTCRYQLASSAEIVAGLTIGWYVLLTSMEVVTLSRQLPRLACRGGVESAIDAGRIAPRQEVV